VDHYFCSVVSCTAAQEVDSIVAPKFREAFAWVAHFVTPLKRR